MESEPKSKSIIRGIIVITSFVVMIFFTYDFMLRPDKIIKEKEVEERTEVYSLDTLKNVEGNFVVGYGNIQNDIYYYVYVQTDKGKILKDFKAKEVYIKDELKEGEGAYILKKYKEKIVDKNKFKFLLSSCLSGQNNIVEDKYVKCTDDNSLTLYVPKGYIKQKYDFDIKK